MAEDIQLEVVTPDRKVLAARVLTVAAPGVLGEFGVLPGHIPFMTPLATGILSYRTSDGAGAMVISRGFAEVANNKVTILAETADLPADVDLAKAQAEVEDLTEKLKGKGEVDPGFEDLKAALLRAMAKVALVAKR